MINKLFDQILEGNKTFQGLQLDMADFHEKYFEVNTRVIELEKKYLRLLRESEMTHEEMHSRDKIVMDIMELARQFVQILVSSGILKPVEDAEDTIYFPNSKKGYTIRTILVDETPEEESGE